jgi:hypothetical protein
MVMKQTSKRYFPSVGLTAALLLGLAGCGGGSSSSPSTPTTIDGAGVFPAGLAVASPVGMEVGTVTLAQASPAARLQALALALFQGDLATAKQLASRLIPVGDAQAAASRSPRYMKSANAVNALLTGTTAPRAGVGFNADKFLKTPINAGCYGPTVLYQGHPDWVAGNPPKDGTLPSGDVGIWTAVDTATDWVCAAAQLDARMDGVALRSNTSLMTLASLINVANTAGKSLPAVGATVDLKAEMNVAFSPDVTFTTATISQPVAGSYSYSVAFSFTHGASTRNAEIRLSHAPGASKSEYSGLLTYAVTRGAGDLQNCPGASGGTVDVGTLKYTRTTRTAMTLVHREGNYCGAGTATPLATSYANFSGDGQLDPAGKWTGTKGWANNFNRFGAVYDPTTLKGNYTFGWQAGFNDGNTRIFNMGLNYDTATEARSGEAYFGYGDDIASSTGTIKGFICNWAGPSSSHTLKDFFQRQHITFNDTTGKWRPSLEAASSSNITYAPTNACTSAGGAFYYDKNAGSVTPASLADELAAPNPAVAVDMADRVFGTTTYATIPLAIAGRGVTVPSY